MKQELHWLAQHLEEFRAATRRSAWYLSDLQEYRGELAQVWRDACSEEMARRFLDPVAQEGGLSLTELERQLELLQSCGVALDASAEQITAAVEASGQAHNHLDEAHSIFRVLDSIVGETMDRANETDAHVRRTEELIEAAKSIGV